MLFDRNGDVGIVKVIDDVFWLIVEGEGQVINDFLDNVFFGFIEIKWGLGFCWYVECFDYICVNKIEVLEGGIVIFLWYLIYEGLFYLVVLFNGFWCDLVWE